MKRTVKYNNQGKLVEVLSTVRGDLHKGSIACIGFRVRPMYLRGLPPDIEPDYSKIVAPTKGWSYVPNTFYRLLLREEIPEMRVILVGKSLRVAGKLRQEKSDEIIEIIPFSYVQVWMVVPYNTDRYYTPFPVLEDDLDVEIVDLQRVLPGLYAGIDHVSEKEG